MWSESREYNEKLLGEYMFYLRQIASRGLDQTELPDFQTTYPALPIHLRP
jgi:hypothetical protein